MTDDCIVDSNSNTERDHDTTTMNIFFTSPEFLSPSAIKKSSSDTVRSSLNTVTPTDKMQPQNMEFSCKDVFVQEVKIHDDCRDRF